MFFAIENKIMHMSNSHVFFFELMSFVLIYFFLKEKFHLVKY